MNRVKRKQMQIQVTRPRRIGQSARPARPDPPTAEPDENCENDADTVHAQTELATLGAADEVPGPSPSRGPIDPPLGRAFSPILLPPVLVDIRPANPWANTVPLDTGWSLFGPRFSDIPIEFGGGPSWTTCDRQRKRRLLYPATPTVLTIPTLPPDRG